MAHRRSRLHAPVGLGAHAADVVVRALGSWAFLIAQTVAVGGWVMVNALLHRPFDPYPFILLNLLFSTQAAYASPLILMAGNRAAARDRARDDLEAAEVDEMHAVLAHIRDLDEQMHELNTRQLAILQRLGGADPAAPPTAP